MKHTVEIARWTCDCCGKQLGTTEAADAEASPLQGLRLSNQSTSGTEWLFCTMDCLSAWIRSRGYVR
jgi:hypothetical protein